MPSFAAALSRVLSVTYATIERGVRDAGGPHGAYVGDETRPRRTRMRR
jgi:hypothetical protein